MKVDNDTDMVHSDKKKHRKKIKREKKNKNDRKRRKSESNSSRKSNVDDNDDMSFNGNPDDGGTLRRYESADPLPLVPPVYDTSDNDSDDNGNRNKRNNKRKTPAVQAASIVSLEVLAPNPVHDPLVISFPRGMPRSLLTRESDIIYASKFSCPSSAKGNEGSISRNNEEDMLTASVLPTFVWSEAANGFTIKGSDGGNVDKNSRRSTKNKNDSDSDDSDEEGVNTESVITYTSSEKEYKRRNQDKRCTNFYVCLYDKKLRKLTLTPSAGKGSVYSLDISVNGDDANNPSSIFANASIASMTPSQRSQLLQSTFGSSKKTKAAKSQKEKVVKLKNIVGNSENMMNSVLESKIDENMTTEEALARNSGGSKVDHDDPLEMAYMKARRAFLPPFDMNATEPHTVYDAIEIAGFQAWDQISEFVDSIVYKLSEARKQAKRSGRGDAILEWKELLISSSRASPSFNDKRKNNRDDEKDEYWSESARKVLTDMVGSLEPGTGTSVIRSKVKVLVLLNHMLRFYKKFAHVAYNSHGKQFRGKGSDHVIGVSRCTGVPHEICDRFLDCFAGTAGERGGYVVTKQRIDSLLVHILILYVIVHGREMKISDIMDVCDDIKVDAKKSVDLLKEAGFTCVPKKDKETKNISIRVKLTVPLTFPPPKKKRAKSKKNQLK